MAATTRTIRVATDSERSERGCRDVFDLDGGARWPATGTSTHLVRASVGLRIDYPGQALDSSALDCPAIECSAVDSSALDC